MTYGRVRVEKGRRPLDGAAVSHSAELVRGELKGPLSKAPSSAPSRRRRAFGSTGHLLPKGRREPLRAFCSSLAPRRAPLPIGERT
jgi:hypothetical protein